MKGASVEHLKERVRARELVWERQLHGRSRQSSPSRKRVSRNDLKRRLDEAVEFFSQLQDGPPTRSARIPDAGKSLD